MIVCLKANLDQQVKLSQVSLLPESGKPIIQEKIRTSGKIVLFMVPMHVCLYLIRRADAPSILFLKVFTF